MNASERKVRRWCLAGMVAGGLITGGIAMWWLRIQGHDPRQVLEWVLAQVRGMGPAAFFTMMALLPAAGVPVTFFNLTAGSVFVPVLGLPLVFALVLTSLGVNLILTYAVGRWLLRPWMERVVAWFGFKVPAVPVEEQPTIIVLLRVIPGPPFMAQNYLMGMGRFRFGTYLSVSLIMAMLDAGIYILFGSALVEGSGRLAILAASLLVALVLGGRWIRRSIRKEKVAIAWVQTSEESVKT